MRCLLIMVRASAGGGESLQRREVEAGVLTIGRGTDQHIHVPDLRVALKHAHISVAGRDSVLIESLSRSGVTVNGYRRQDCALSVGDEVELGATRISVLPPEPGFDLALRVRAAAGRGEGPQEPRQISSRGGGSGLRLLSWAVFIAVLYIGLIDPLVKHYAPERRLPGAAAVLPGTDGWLPGPMAAPHEYFGHDCTTCHQHPFQPVADEACKDCHADMALHVPAAPAGLADPASRGCESCHFEHEGADRLIVTTQAFCADCHVDTSAFTGQASQAGAATDFALEHPPFRASVARFDARGGLEFLRAPVGDPDTFEQSNLLFPHDVHLDPEGVDAPDGSVVMQCADCHATEPGGELMTAIDFDAHCGSCHLLAFDLSAPARQVPHGDPQAALDVLVDFYAQLALRGGSDEVRIEPLQAASPGDALAWARAQAATAAVGLFEERACMQCHQVTRVDDESPMQWEIPPIRLNHHWLPAARFSHEAHAVAECADCHDVAASGSSADILLPDIDTCRECHGGETAAGSLTSSCVTCHDFHVPPREEPAFTGKPVRGSLNLQAMPDLEAAGREARGADSRRRRPGDSE